ncbi:MAG: hypothetical protein ACE5FT_01770 [Candidatus Nanoarchaeia archaeon]
MEDEYLPVKGNPDFGGVEVQSGSKDLAAVGQEQSYLMQIVRDYPIIAKVAVAGMIAAQTVTGGLVVYQAGQISAMKATAATATAVGSVSNEINDLGDAVRDLKHEVEFQSKSQDIEFRRTRESAYRAARRSAKIAARKRTLRR